LLLTLGGRGVDHAGPRDVVVDRVGRLLLAPHVDQDEIALADGLGGARLRRVMRIAAVRVHAYDRSIVECNSLAVEGVHDPLLNVVLIATAIAHPPADLLEGLGHDAVDRFTRRKMRLDLLLGQGRLKARHQIAGTHNRVPKAAHQLDGAAVDHPDGRHQVVGRILHGQRLVWCQHFFQVRVLLFPSGVKSLGAGQGIEVSGLNAMVQLGRLALRGDHVIPAARHMQAGGQPQHAVGDGVAMMMVVKEPSVKAALGQG
jgi:hypothetical protein